MISTAVTAILADNTRPYPVAYNCAGDPSVSAAPATPADQQRHHAQQRQLREPRQQPGPLPAMLDGQHQPGQRTAPQRRRQCVKRDRESAERAFGKVARERAGGQADGGDACDRDVHRRGPRRRHGGQAHRGRGRDTEQTGPPGRRVQCEIQIVCTPSLVTGTAAAWAAATTSRVSSASSQTADAATSGPVARPISSSRYRSTSSIGTAARPNVVTAAQSATARTSVAVSELCGYASDHAATDADRDDQRGAGHRPMARHFCRRTAHNAPAPTITTAATANGHTGTSSPPDVSGVLVAVADGPGVPVPADG